MAAVVNDTAPAVGSKLPLDGIQMAGKTGTAQVFRLGERGAPVELGRFATMRCSLPSPRPKRRVTPLAASLSMAASAHRPPHRSFAIA